jgi:hypothetical protein
MAANKMMQQKIIKLCRVFLLITASLLLITGCTTQRNLYHWGDYQPQVYQYLKGQSNSPKEQILAMEKIIQQAKAKNKPLPPGFYAHLGLLELSEGNGDSARSSFEMERELFPESKDYMNFLLSRMNGNSTQVKGK